MSKLFPVIPLLLVLTLTLMGEKPCLANNTPHDFQVRVEKDGLAIIRAKIMLPARPDLVFRVLTDYTHWPLLFPDGVEVQVVRLSESRIVTDMLIPHKILSSKTRLKTESVETPPFKLETKLLEGDYLQYDQLWQLTPIQEGTHTSAELRLLIQPKGWIMNVMPEFLYRWVIKVDLQEHFEKLRQKVLEKK